jgi:DNA ligase-1
LEEYHLSGIFPKTSIFPLFILLLVQISDVPSRGEEPFEDRYKYLEESFGENGTLKASQIVVVEHEQATSRDHVLEKLKEIESLGGEGLMLRKPGSYVLFSSLFL